MEKELKIIDVGNKYGNINLSAKFFPKNFSKEDILKQFNLSRELIGFEYGFDGHKLYVADQIKDDGSYFEITEDYVEAYPEGWTDIPEDILVMSDKVQGAAIGHPVADCPVVVAHDKRQRVIAIGHCGTYHTDKMLPVSVVDALLKSHGSRDEDIEVHVTAGADKESYKKIMYPNYLKNLKVWDKHIYKGKFGLYHIDLKGAIKDQLLYRNIKEENIFISDIDTITNPDFYSHYASNHGHKEKSGNNFAGATFGYNTHFNLENLRSILMEAEKLSEIPESVNLPTLWSIDSEEVLSILEKLDYPESVDFSNLTNIKKDKPKNR